MLPKFAEAVDPIFLRVLGLLDRIERNEPIEPAEEQERIRAEIDRAEQRMTDREQWQLAKYAIVSWIDEVLIEAPWDGRDYFKENILEFQYFQTAECFVKFYHNATDAARLPRKDALEIFYVCVVLGFRGLYRDPEAASVAEEVGLPPDLESWARRTAQMIRHGQGLPPLDPKRRELPGAPPLEGKFNLLGMSLAALTLAFANILVAWFLFWR